MLRIVRTEKKRVSNQIQSIENLLKEIESRLKENAELAEDEHGRKLDAENIHLAVDAITEAIIRDDVERKIILFPMDGALPYASAIRESLAKKGAADILWFTVKATSYEGTSCGALTVNLPSKANFIDAVVYVADDVIDTGQTSLKLKELLMNAGAKNVKFTPLVDKFKAERKIQAWHAGFKISPEAFIIGFGLDYKNYCRNFDKIVVASPELLPNEEEMIALSQLNALRDSWMMHHSQESHAAAQDIQKFFRKY